MMNELVLFEQTRENLAIGRDQWIPASPHHHPLAQQRCAFCEAEADGGLGHGPMPVYYCYGCGGDFAFAYLRLTGMNELERRKLAKAIARRELGQGSLVSVEVSNVDHGQHL